MSVGPSTLPLSVTCAQARMTSSILLRYHSLNAHHWSPSNCNALSKMESKHLTVSPMSHAPMAYSSTTASSSSMTLLGPGVSVSICVGLEIGAVANLFWFPSGAPVTLHHGSTQGNRVICVLSACIQDWEHM